MTIFKVKNYKLSSGQWRQVLSALRAGGVIIFPTDTAYGFGVDPRVRGAAGKIFAIKGREGKKPLSVIVSSLAMARRYGKFSPLALRLARQHWPGALTLVVPLKKTAAARQLRTLRGGYSVGFRYPDHPIAAALAKKLGFPITATSANRSGQKPCYSLREFLKQFGAGSSPLGSNNMVRQAHHIFFERSREVPLPDLFLDAGSLPRRPTSTVVECTSKEPKILRQGAVRIAPDH
jgi:tRNA threonylcarbamoyl adenosine modification protein (Sua5/YciO/YrdC/YwlC family)